MSFRIKPGKSYSPPAGVYRVGGSNPSRTTGTDIDGEVYQVSNSRHTSRQKFQNHYDDVKWDEEEK